MNKQFFKMAGLAALVLLLQTTGFAQSDELPRPDDNDTMPGRSRSLDEITIRHKGNKDAKLTIEIRNGEVYINGKPASEYKDEDLTITKRKFKTLGDGDFAFSDGDGGPMALTPFRMRKFVSSGAFLGVTSAKPETGPAGAKVKEVSEGSAAEKAGLKEGDVITKVDDKTIEGPEALANTIRSHKPGDKIAITYLRGGKEQKSTTDLGRTKASTFRMDGADLNFETPPGMDWHKFSMPRGYGFSYNENSLRLGIHAQDTEDGKGVKVLDVDEETAAAKAGIKEGDIITRYDGQEVNSATRLAELARSSREDKARTSVKISLLRGGKPLDVEVKIPRRLRTADL